jgi:hypothetical protein
MNYPLSYRYLPNYDNWKFKGCDDPEPTDDDLSDPPWTDEDNQIDQLQPPFDS